MRAFLLLLSLAQATGFSLTTAFRQHAPSAVSLKAEAPFGELSVGTSSSRREFIQYVPTALLFSQVAMLSASPEAANAYTPTGSKDGNLPELPTEAVRSYLQYRIPLQIAADFYVFELQGMVGQTDSWGEVNQLFQVNNNKGQGNPSRIERDFVNPMRIILLSMPPDVSEDMRTAQFKFEASMQGITKAVRGYSRDLPVEIDSSSITKAQASWEGGRVALNEFFALLNDVTGLPLLKGIPAAGPKQRDEYGRSSRRYFDLVKKTKLCQNRGGPALSQAWGTLMVSGYLQDSCGIPDLEDYFYQGRD
jgi:hypothetical protein